MDNLAPNRRLRAPRTSGQALVEPPLSSVGRLLQQNALVRHRLTDVHFLESSIGDLATDAKSQCLALAIEYTRNYRPVTREWKQPPRLLFAGHQPELFHPGVWFKNFVLDVAARRHNLVPINLIVDNDVCRRTSIRVPSGDRREPTAPWLPFDSPGGDIAWEEREVRDTATFESFGQRVSDAVRPFVAAPLIETYWPMVLKRRQSTNKLGECLAQARHLLDEQIGLTTLDLPVSRLCQLRAFAWFASHLIVHAPLLHAAYNAAVIEYRQTHHIRSAAHPVPNLGVDGDAFEVPLWVWRKKDLVRRRLFVRQRTDGVTLLDRNGWSHDLPLIANGDNTVGIEELVGLGTNGVRIRPRALTMTMFVRLVLAELFIHGIGGAKYDELTDRLIAAWFNRRSPGIMTATATLQLPIEREAISPDDARHVDRQLRELRFQPERHVDLNLARSPDESSRMQNLLESKDRWTRLRHEDMSADVTRRARHVHIEVLNRAMQPWVETKRASLLARREELARALRAEAVLSSREYAFCLFPQTWLVEQLRRLAQP